MTKPRKKLTGAVFFGNGLRGDHPSGDPNKVLRLSRIVARLGPNTFETMNSIYDVEFLPGGEATIPSEWAL